jgi:hypothetical protein
VINYSTILYPSHKKLAGFGHYCCFCGSHKYICLSVPGDTLIIPL